MYRCLWLDFRHVCPGLRRESLHPQGNSQLLTPTLARATPHAPLRVQRTSRIMADNCMRRRLSRKIPNAGCHGLCVGKYLLRRKPSPFTKIQALARSRRSKDIEAANGAEAAIMVVALIGMLVVVVLVVEVVGCRRGVGHGADRHSAGCGDGRCSGRGAGCRSVGCRGGCRGACRGGAGRVAGCRRGS